MKQLQANGSVLILPTPRRVNRHLHVKWARPNFGITFIQTDYTALNQIVASLLYRDKAGNVWYYCFGLYPTALLAYQEMLADGIFASPFPPATYTGETYNLLWRPRTYSKFTTLEYISYVAAH